jgi:hypothetical protein
VADVHRPRVPLRTAAAPPRLPLCMHPKTWQL